MDVEHSQYFASYQVKLSVLCNCGLLHNIIRIVLFKYPFNHHCKVDTRRNDAELSGRT